MRGRDRVAATLQKVVTAVLGLLAPILAVGLLAFLLLLPFRGVGLLWDATKFTTPILVLCIASALVLANAVLGDSEEEEPRSALGREVRITTGMDKAADQ